ncbi:hypothetical protein AMTR_s00013p00159470 [Amborella trichopoda]|uniref:Uncharacterized protein n=1 Tax=Amborella trichopoda TaxID=13333 RepID=W1PRM0_AMBTC|nr:hypothetical protein AMTR_s00013p00159470 [Amborella trichopoda]
MFALPLTRCCSSINSSCPAPRASQGLNSYVWLARWRTERGSPLAQPYLSSAYYGPSKIATTLKKVWHDGAGLRINHNHSREQCPHMLRSQNHGYASHIYSGEGNRTDIPSKDFFLAPQKPFKIESLRARVFFVWG